MIDLKLDDGNGLDVVELLHTTRPDARVVVLTGGTLGLAVATWAFSPIKFQADMGILLAFMFVWNMLGALILLPALSCFLLTGGKGKFKSA